jgi:hypothetical protein
VDRLEERKPQYGLDHLVKERYPTFQDALRDMDDPLTLVQLFARLPADKRHGIPSEVVQRSRTLALEFESYVVKTNALRKCFISVKGIYYQAVVYGEELTWMTPHALAQTLPEDVDYRVMLTFLEFYVAMTGFVNYKLYHDRGLRYPPLLDSKLEDNAGGIVAVIHTLEDGAKAVGSGSKRWARSSRRSRRGRAGRRWTRRSSRRESSRRRGTGRRRRSRTESGVPGSAAARATARTPWVIPTTRRSKTPSRRRWARTRRDARTTSSARRCSRGACSSSSESARRT